MDKIQEEHSRILRVLRVIDGPDYTAQPLRTRLWSKAATTCAPELSELEDQHKKWFSDCEFNMAPAKDCLDDLDRIQDRVADLWLRSGATLPPPDANPHVALEAAQSSLEQKPTTENITSYLHAMALLVYSSRKTLEYLTCMLSLWVFIAKTHCGDMYTEVDTKNQILRCSAALFYEQETWDLLMDCPWTVACALHLLVDDAPEPRTNPRTELVPTDPERTVDAESDDEKRDIRVLNGNPARPRESASVFAAVDNTRVQRMLEGCFRLGATTREENQLFMAVKPFTNSEDQKYKRTLHIKFVSDMSGHEVEVPDVFQMIREYWKQEAYENTAREGFDLLLELADTPEWLGSHFHMSLSRPKAHPECILAQHWMTRQHLTNQVFPHIGVSSHVCRTCSSFLWEVFHHTDWQRTAYEPDFTMSSTHQRMIPGTRDAYHMCMLPAQSPIPVKERVASLLRYEIRRFLRVGEITALLEGQLSAARGEDIGSGSYRPEPDGDRLEIGLSTAKDFLTIL